MTTKDIQKLRDKLFSELLMSYGKAILGKTASEPFRNFRSQRDYFKVVSIVTIDAIIDNRDELKLEFSYERIESNFNQIEQNTLEL